MRAPPTRCSPRAPVGDAFSMDICPHDRPRFAERGEDFEGRAETERGYVLYPRRR